jgi:hypothetical protein
VGTCLSCDRFFTSLAKSRVFHKVVVPQAKVTRELIAAVHALKEQLLGGGGDDRSVPGDDDGDSVASVPSGSPSSPAPHSVLIKVHDSGSKLQPGFKPKGHDGGKPKHGMQIVKEAILISCVCSA